jgi:hypothetical protein
MPTAERDLGLLDIEVEIVERNRALGHDYAVYRLTPPADAPAPLREGYRASVAQKTGTQEPDRFIKKWLQLRLNALRRGRWVSESVTPDFLRQIDVPTCPVTLETLTHGQRQPSDWSVDRLYNDGAYATINLAIMSTRANTAKGNKSLAEVIDLSRGSNAGEELSKREWARMSALMFAACSADAPKPEKDPRLPQVAPLPEHLPRYDWQVMQDALVGMVTGCHPVLVDALPEVLNEMPDTQSRTLTKQVIARIQDNVATAPIPYDVWFDDEMVKRLNCKRSPKSSSRRRPAGVSIVSA